MFVRPVVLEELKRKYVHRHVRGQNHALCIRLAGFARRAPSSNFGVKYFGSGGCAGFLSYFQHNDINGNGFCKVINDILVEAYQVILF